MVEEEVPEKVRVDLDQQAYDIYKFKNSQLEKSIKEVNRFLKQQFGEFSSIENLNEVISKQRWGRQSSSKVKDLKQYRESKVAGHKNENIEQLENSILQIEQEQQVLEGELRKKQGETSKQQSQIKELKIQQKIEYQQLNQRLEELKFEQN